VIEANQYYRKTKHCSRPNWNREYQPTVAEKQMSGFVKASKSNMNALAAFSRLVSANSIGKHV